MLDEPWGEIRIPRPKIHNSSLATNELGPCSYLDIAYSHELFFPILLFLNISYSHPQGRSVYHLADMAKAYDDPLVAITTDKRFKPVYGNNVYKRDFS